MRINPQIERPYKGDDRLLFGIIMGVVAFWLFAQTTLNIAPDMGRALGVDANVMNVAVAITSLFSGMSGAAYADGFSDGAALDGGGLDGGGMDGGGMDGAGDPGGDMGGGFDDGGGFDLGDLF